MRTAAFAVVMMVVAAAAGLWVVYGTHNAAGWVLVMGALPWAILAYVRLTGGPRKME